jgi:hypothetical protein
MVAIVPLAFFSQLHPQLLDLGFEYLDPFLGIVEPAEPHDHGTLERLVDYLATRPVIGGLVDVSTILPRLDLAVFLHRLQTPSRNTSATDSSNATSASLGVTYRSLSEMAVDAPGMRACSHG